jgi:hypothetical protein
MERKHKLARLITESAVIEEVSVHWLQLTVLWRGPLANRPDVCLIWRQRGRRSDEWTAEEDAIVKAYYPSGDKWDILEALPRRSWNMIYQRAMKFELRRNVYAQESIPENITIDDLNVIPNRTISLNLAMKAGKRRKKQEFQAYVVRPHNRSCLESLIQSYTKLLTRCAVVRYLRYGNNGQYSRDVSCDSTAKPSLNMLSISYRGTGVEDIYSPYVTCC